MMIGEPWKRPLAVQRRGGGGGGGGGGRKGDKRGEKKESKKDIFHTSLHAWAMAVVAVIAGW
jgi:hypothetical protein